ncbi:MAG: CoA pyrophosphatase [Granulosicoccus sp.]
MPDKLTTTVTSDEGLHRDSDVPLGDEIVGHYSGSSNMRRAAVLIPLIRQSGDWHILYIRRASNENDRHSGQVAFPGGGSDAEDNSPEATALRETREEIGIAANRISLLGQLSPYTTISDFHVTPVVGVVEWPTNLTLAPLEVARAFLIPLEWLRQRGNFSLRARQDMDPTSAKRHPIIVFEPYDGETLWGASARMTVNFIRSLDRGEIVLPAA